MSDDSVSILAELPYANPRVALEWLAQAFGSTTRLQVADDAGQLVYSEAGWGDCLVAVVPQQGEKLRSPLGTGGINTQSMRVRLKADIDAHCERARVAGAVIVQAPITHFFGDRTYIAADLEGHLWSFAQRIEGAGGPPPADWSVKSA